MSKFVKPGEIKIAKLKSLNSLSKNVLISLKDLFPNRIFYCIFKLNFQVCHIFNSLGANYI